MIAISVVKKQAITIYVLLYEEISYCCFQIKVLKHKLRISVLFIFRHCSVSYLLPLSHSLNNPKCYTCRFLCKTFFFTYHRSQDFFKDKFPLQEFIFGNVAPPPVISNTNTIIGLTAQYLPWHGGEMTSFETIPTHAFNFFVKYAIFESGNSFIMTIIFPWSKILSMRNFTLSRLCFKLFKRAMRNNHYLLM